VPKIGTVKVRVALILRSTHATNCQYEREKYKAESSINLCVLTNNLPYELTLNE
jgi:hypothetical protein